MTLTRFNPGVLSIVILHTNDMRHTKDMNGRVAAFKPSADQGATGGAGKIATLTVSYLREQGKVDLLIALAHMAYEATMRTGDSQPLRLL